MLALWKDVNIHLRYDNTVVSIRKTEYLFFCQTHTGNACNRSHNNTRVYDGIAL